MKNFPKRSIFNPGGLGSFYFISSDQVVKLPGLLKGRVDRVLEFKPGAHWLIGYATSDSLKFTEKTQLSDHGAYYDQNLTGHYPGDGAEVQDLFSDMEQIGITYYVVFVDLLGKQRLAGYAGDLNFSADFSSEEKRYAFSFEGKALEKAPLYPYIINL